MTTRPLLLLCHLLSSSLSLSSYRGVDILHHEWQSFRVNFKLCKVVLTYITVKHEDEVPKIDTDTTIRSALTSSIEWKWCKASSSLPSSCRNEKLTIFRAKKGSSRPKTTRNFNDATDEIASTRAIDYWYHYVTINKLSILTKEMTTASASLGYIVKTNVDAVFTASLRSARRRRRIIILIV